MIAARYASLLAFAQSRGSDCGRGEDGKFGSGNKCQVTDGVLKPDTVEPHDSEPSFKDEDDDHVYHVTTAGNAESILSGGFKQSPHTVKGGSYESYSKGKVFFTEKSGLATWKSKIEDHLFHSHDDPPPVAIVKVKKSEVDHLLKPDEIGTKDAGAKAYYVDLSGKKKEGRGFCPTGPGGGIKNTCGTGDAGPKMAPDTGDGGGSVAVDEAPSLHLLAERDAEAPQETIKSGDGEVAVVDRTDVSTPDYLDEIECHGRNCDLEVTFDMAKQLQPHSEIADDWSPLDAYVGPGAGYFTGYAGSLGPAADSSIDYHGAEYGTIDDYQASDLLAEKQKEVEKEWDSMRDDEKNLASMKLLYGVESQPSDEDDPVALREAGKKEWMQKNTAEFEESIDAMREEARRNAVKQMARELEAAVAADTIECCLQLYRGISVDPARVDEIIAKGYVVHEGVNSWTTSRGTARAFGANKLLLVVRKPRVGHVFSSNAHDEKEVVRPPSRMRILGVVRTSTGTVLHVDEDEDYKEA